MRQKNRDIYVGAACALRACGDACLEPGCECECHEVPGGIRPAGDVVVAPEELRAIREALDAAMSTGTNRQETP